jgi:DNA-binding response OmpR family regulator
MLAVACREDWSAVQIQPTRRNPAMNHLPDPTANVFSLHPARVTGRDAALDSFARQTTRAVRTLDFEIDLLDRCVRYPDGEEVLFTPHQWRLLEALVAAAPGAITAPSLAAQVFEPEDTKDGDDIVLLVSQLRRKLDPDPSAPRYFRAVGPESYAFGPSEQVQL